MTRSSSKDQKRPAPLELRRRQSSINLRNQILDAAEELFAEIGYDGTSIRDVANEAGVRLALVSYHIGNKDVLFDEVIARRASVLADLRNGMLDEALRRTGGAPLAIEDIVSGYVFPFVERSSRGGKGWSNYTRLVARLANSPQWDGIIGKYYDNVARRYIEELGRALPALDQLEVMHRFSFMIGTMLAIVAEPGRVERLSRQKVAADDLETIFQSMLPFLAAGFRCLPPAARSASKKAAAVNLG